MIDPETVYPVDRFCSDAHKTFFNRRMAPALYLLGCNVPKRFLKCRFDNYQILTESTQKAHTELSSLKNLPPSVYLSGPVGTGKTHLSVALMQKMSTVLEPKVLFVSASEIMSQIKECFANGTNYVKQLNFFTRQPILVIDDLGVGKETEFVTECWHHILDWRYSHMQPTIITSNLNLGMISERLGKRIASRLVHGMVLNLKGEDWRIKNG